MENRAVRPRGFSIILLAAFLTIAAGWLKAVYAADIEAVLDDAAGASVFSVKDSSSVEGAHIDSDGNMVIKGGLRLDVSGAEHTTAENLIVDGSVGIGDTSPASALTVGLGDLFQVDTSGDIIKLKNITYAWPSSQAAGSSYVLTNNGAGTLSWTAPGGISASSALSAITAAIAANTIANANFAQAWNWDTLTTETAMALGSTSITSGKLLSLSSSATGFTGTMQDITLSGNNAANTGTLFKSTVSGVASAAVPLMITNAGTGLSLRVNDDGTDTDTTPVVVDASGNVGIGTTGPASPLEINHATAAYIDLENTTTQTASGIKFTNVGTLKWTLKKDYINSEHNLVFQDASSNNVLFLQQGGNVGIGTTGPDAKFKVLGASGSIYSNSLAKFYASSTQGVYVGYNTASKYGYIGAITEGVTHDPLVLEPSGGKVGIGTTGPGAKLHIWSSNAGAVTDHTSAVLILEQGSNPILQFQSANTQSAVGIVWGDPEDNDVGRIVYDHTTDKFSLWTAGSQNMVLDTSGNVGIGTTSPAVALDVNGAFLVRGAFPGHGASRGGLDYSIGTTRFWSWGANDSTKGAFQWENRSSAGTLGDTVMAIDSTGNVGIGTAAPAAKLHIDGDNARQLSIDKSTVAVTAPGAGVGMLRWEAGTNAGTLKLVAYAGTSITGTTVVDNVGAGN